MIGVKTDIASAWLRAGNVVGIPTETVYGLAANALNERAVSKIFEVKKRPFFDPLIVHVSGFEEIERYGKNAHPLLIKLAKRFMPGPITILLEKDEAISDLVTAGSKFVALRMPMHPLTQRLMREIDFPLAAPSANPFGYVSPTTAGHVEDQLGALVPYILDGGPCRIGLESTIVGMDGDTLVVYRKGGLPIEELEKYSNKIEIKEHSISNPVSPGMLESHYAPNVPLHLCDDFSSLDYTSEKVGIISFGESSDRSYGEAKRFVLSHGNDFNEAAARLFRILRELESFDLDRAYVKLLPEIGLGRAINDRLKRAAVKKPTL